MLVEMVSVGNTLELVSALVGNSQVSGMAANLVVME